MIVYILSIYYLDNVEFIHLSFPCLESRTCFVCVHIYIYVLLYYWAITEVDEKEYKEVQGITVQIFTHPGWWSD